MKKERGIQRSLGLTAFAKNKNGMLKSLAWSVLSQFGPFGQRSYESSQGSRFWAKVNLDQGQFILTKVCSFISGSVRTVATRR